jgi:hypothetical protein
MVKDFIYAKNEYLQFLDLESLGFYTKNQRFMLINKGVLRVCLKWRPSWAPSWISRNAQYLAGVTRRILKGDTLVY